LVGPSNIGINIFTGGFVYATDATIAGMKDVTVWLHHGGSGRFTSTLLQIGCCDTKEVILDEIQAVPELKIDPPVDRLFRSETARSVIATACFVPGKGMSDI
jgi:hypothetical protein